MFDLGWSAGEARRLDRAGNIYHRGQALAWNGQEVLAELVERHGGIRVAADKRSALGAVFGSILWGELAAWKISAQLADRLEPLEAKMAATSQAHDEARHFYVMHDYLVAATGAPPPRLHPASEALLAAVLETDDLPSKLLGMQLQIETTALTLFQHAREARICPVLSELLPYFEKDEARHVGLGTQVLPMLMRRMSRREGLRFSAFAVGVTYRLLAANHAMTEPMRTLGLDPRRVLQLAKSKQMLVFEQLWEVTVGRARAFVAGLARGIDEVPTSIEPGEPASK
jgi:hypothetical protein